jgi:Cd2+/Zn2+-exporting ATPase
MNNATNVPPIDIPLESGCSCCHVDHDHDHDHEETTADQHHLPREGTSSLFLVRNMCCPTEERIIRKALESMNGIHRLDFNLLDRQVTVHHSLASTEGILSLLSSINMSPVELETTRAEQPAEPALRAMGGSWWLLGFSGAAAIGSEVIAWVTGRENSSVIMALVLVSILTGGMPIIKRGWAALKTFSLNINFLMTVAAVGAIAIGQWPEAAVVIWLFAIADRIEALSLDRARNAIRGLMAISPETATVRDEGGQWRAVEAASVRIGQICRVRPGERVPLDGVVTAGYSSVNQAPITGESLPVEKTEGDTVFAGTVNENGVFEFRVTGDYEHTTLARIIHAVQQAQTHRAPTQRMVDAFAERYTPVVVVIALLVAVIPPLFMGLAWSEWIYKALVLLVISCPCALVISIPVSVVSSLAAAAHHGILVKGGVYLEGGRKLRFVALDKTGTLTWGKPAVTDVIPLESQDAAGVLRIAASLEEHAGHPIARSIVERWNSDSRREPVLGVTAFRNMPGRGVAGEIDGASYFLGNLRLMEELDIREPGLEETLSRLEGEGKTGVVLASAAGPLAIIGVADVLRDSAKRAIASLHDLGIRTVMLSGDNLATVRAMGAGAGIDDVRGNLLPDDKLTAITELQQSGSVGMVGDGINDAPALAQSNIGFAMGAAGSDTALETADVALMDDDLNKIPDFIHLSRKTWGIITQNVVFALAIKALFFGLALAGEATLWMAVFADMGVSLLVIFNSLRLLSFFNGKAGMAAVS